LAKSFIGGLHSSIDKFSKPKSKLKVEGNLVRFGTPIRKVIDDMSERFDTWSAGGNIAKLEVRDEAATVFANLTTKSIGGKDANWKDAKKVHVPTKPIDESIKVRIFLKSSASNVKRWVTINLNVL
jgi:hypothetical protein